MSTTRPDNNAPVENEIEESLSCPLSGSIFKIPVTLLPGGHTVEEDMAKNLIASNLNYPSNGNKVTGYVRNWAVQSAVDAYLKAHPEAKTKQYVSPPIEEKKPQEQSPAVAVAAANPNITIAAQASPASIQPVLPAHQTPQPPVEEKPLIRLPVAVAVLPGVLQPGGPRLYAPATWKCKTLLLGEAEAGKTTFLNAVTDGGFGCLSPNPITTIGIDFKITTIEDFKFHIWDTAGQERLRVMTDGYLPGVQLILFFGDNTADALKWINYIRVKIPGMLFHELTYERQQDNTLTPRTIPFDENTFRTHMSNANLPASVRHQEAYGLGRTLLCETAKMIRLQQQAGHAPAVIVEEQKGGCSMM